MNVCFILPYGFSLIYSISLLLPIFSYFSLIPCPLFFPLCPLSFSFLTCQTAYLFLFSFPIWLSLLSSFSLSFFCASSTLFHSYFLSLYHPHFFFSLYVFLSHFHSTLTSTPCDLLSLSIVMPVLVIPMDIFVLIFEFAASEGKKNVMLALPDFAHS